MVCLQPGHFEKSSSGTSGLAWGFSLSERLGLIRIYLSFLLNRAIHPPFQSHTFYIILFLDSVVRKFPSRMKYRSPLQSHDDLKSNRVENQHW